MEEISVVFYMGCVYRKWCAYPATLDVIIVGVTLSFFFFIRRQLSYWLTFNGEYSFLTYGTPCVSVEAAELYDSLSRIGICTYVCSEVTVCKICSYCKHKVTAPYVPM